MTARLVMVKTGSESEITDNGQSALNVTLESMRWQCSIYQLLVSQCVPATLQAAPKPYTDKNDQ